MNLYNQPIVIFSFFVLQTTVTWIVGEIFLAKGPAKLENVVLFLPRISKLFYNMS